MFKGAAPTRESKGPLNEWLYSIRKWIDHLLQRAREMSAVHRITNCSRYGRCSAHYNYLVVLNKERLWLFVLQY